MTATWSFSATICIKSDLFVMFIFCCDVVNNDNVNKVATTVIQHIIRDKTSNKINNKTIWLSGITT